jgi:hypothetical protein
MADNSATGASAPAVAAATDNSSVDSNAPLQAKEPEAAPDFRKHKHKLKVNDREEELDYDAVLELAQKGKASGDVFRKAAAKEKQMAALLDKAKAGDLDWLEDIAGSDQLNKWAEKKLLKLIELNEMSPEKRELMEERAHRAKLEKERDDRLQKDKWSEGAALREQAHQEIDTKIDTAFKAASLPMTPGRLERVAQLMDASLSTEGTLLDPAKALILVQKQMRADTKEILESMTAAEVREFLPKKILDAIRRGDVEDVRAQDPLRRSTRNAAEPQRRASDAKNKRMSTDDFFNKLEKRLGG